MALRKTNIEARIAEINNRIAELPKGNISYHIKFSDRFDTLMQIEERRRLEDEKHLIEKYAQYINLVVARNPYLKNKGGLGGQDFEYIIKENYFYADKTHFIKEWIDSGEIISLIVRPRRFGKTLMLSMMECFFSVRYADKKWLFENLSIGRDKKVMELQGTMPVIFMSFAGIKGQTFENACNDLCSDISFLYREHDYLLQSANISDVEKQQFHDIIVRSYKGDCSVIRDAFKNLCELMYLHYGQKPLFLLDEYDTPMIEAYVHGYWDEMSALMHEIFNRTFKTNRCIGKTVMTGITKITKESLFSDLNNVSVNTITSGRYADCFGFTEEEVMTALQLRDWEELAAVKEWYDGYTICGVKDIYNPWSVSYYLSHRVLQPYWTNSGGTKLIEDIIQHGSMKLLHEIETLMMGESLHKEFYEHFSFRDLDKDEQNIWPLLLASGYVKADNVVSDQRIECDLSFTNKETRIAFMYIFSRWNETSYEYRSFCDSFLKGDLEKMNECMNQIAMSVISIYDVGRKPSEKAPERFYHGFVLGLLLPLEKKFKITSNRESGLFRYDVMFKPKNNQYDAIIVEFKVRDEKKEGSLEETARAALDQINEKNYAQELINEGIEEDRIRKYGFAFEGKRVLISADMRV